MNNPLLLQNPYLTKYRLVKATANQRYVAFSFNKQYDLTRINDKQAAKIFATGCPFLVKIEEPSFMAHEILEAQPEVSDPLSIFPKIGEILDAQPEESDPLSILSEIESNTLIETIAVEEKKPKKAQKRSKKV